MEELIARIAEAANLSPETARNALGIVLNFLEKQAPEQASALIDYIPGAQELIASAAQESPGGIGGMIGSLLGNIGGSGGNLMALGSQLMAEGVSIDQAKTIASELIDFGRRELGEERMAELTAAIPGLSNFI